MLQINTSATFAFLNEDQIACGTVAGALDDNFDSTSQLKIVTISDGSILQTWQVNSKFNTLAYSQIKGGVLVGGLENGEVQLFVPNKPEPVFTKQGAQGPIRGLDTNKLQPNLFATASRGEDLSIWDISNLSSPYSPGQRTPKLNNSDILSLKWNNSIPHILASSGNNGYTVVWDLKNKRQVISLSPPTSASNMGVICEWHPSIPTQLITASLSDSNPVLLTWDLRNAQQPVNTITAHQQGILSISWNTKDPDLILSSSKDCSTCLWDLKTNTNCGQLHHSKWPFQVQWHPVKPWLFGTASFDNTLAIHHLDGDDAMNNASTPNLDQADPFNTSAAEESTEFHLQQPPLWFRIPTCSLFVHDHLLHFTPDQKLVSDYELDLYTKSSHYLSFCSSRALLIEALTSGLLETPLHELQDFKPASAKTLTLASTSPSNADILPQDKELQLYLMCGQFKNAIIHCLNKNEVISAFLIAECDSSCYPLITQHLLQGKDTLNTTTSLLTKIKNKDMSPLEQPMHSLLYLLTYANEEDLVSGCEELLATINKEEPLYCICALLSHQDHLVLEYLMSTLNSTIPEDLLFLHYCTELNLESITPALQSHLNELVLKYFKLFPLMLFTIIDKIPTASLSNESSESRKLLMTCTHQIEIDSEVDVQIDELSCGYQQPQSTYQQPSYNQYNSGYQQTPQPQQHYQPPQAAQPVQPSQQQYQPPQQQYQPPQAVQQQYQPPQPAQASQQQYQPPQPVQPAQQQYQPVQPAQQQYQQSAYQQPAFTPPQPQQQTFTPPQPQQSFQPQPTYQQPQQPSTYTPPGNTNWNDAPNVLQPMRRKSKQKPAPVQPLPNQPLPFQPQVQSNQVQPMQQQKYGNLYSFSSR